METSSIGLAIAAGLLTWCFMELFNLPRKKNIKNEP